MKSLLFAGFAVASVIGCSSAATSPSQPSLVLDPSPFAVASPTASSTAGPTSSSTARASSAATPSPTPTPPPHRPAFRADTGLTTVVDHLRLRSEPSVTDASRRYEPLLPLGTNLDALEGPVAGSGYWWYRVRLTEGQTLFDGVREGWVAAADHDGTPWLAVYRDVDPGPTFPPVTGGWPSVRAGDVSLRGDDVGSEAAGALTVPVEIRGRLPGSTEFLTATGKYWNEWVCGGGPEGEFGNAMTPIGRVAGSAEIGTTVIIGPDGVGRAEIALPADRPTAACPADFPGPVYPMAGRWSDVHVTMPAFGLELRPPAYQWADTL